MFFRNSFTTEIAEAVDLPKLREILEVMEGQLKTQTEEVVTELGLLEGSLKNLTADLSAVSTLLERLPKKDNPI